MSSAAMMLVAVLLACVAVKECHSTVVEMLQIEIPCADTDKFVEVDRSVWTTFLANQTAFVRKEVWVNPQAVPSGNCSVWSVIHWATRAGWKAIPSAELVVVNAKFVDAFVRSLQHTGACF